MHRRYGLLGPNGCGKSSLLKALGNRELPIPDHIDIHFLDREVEASDQTALQAVMSVDTIKGRLEAEAEKLLEKDDAESQQLLEDIYERYAPHQANHLHLLSAGSHPGPMLPPDFETLTHVILSPAFKGHLIQWHLVRACQMERRQAVICYQHVCSYWASK
jgi:hypothetical protein